MPKASSIRTKALVIGGGPAGAIAARTLAGRGLETMLLERNPDFVKPCGGGLPSSAFEELNLPSNLISKEIRNIRIVAPSGAEVSFGLKNGFLAIVERGKFDIALRQIALNAGARVIEATFKGFTEIGGNRVTVLAEARGKQFEITSDYAIGADGAASPVRSALGIKPPSYIYTFSGNAEGASSDACEFWFGSSREPGLYSWVFPSRRGMRVGVGGQRPEGLKEISEDFMKLRGVSGSEFRGYKIPLWENGKFGTGRVLLVGDAAAQVMPFTFEGMYYSMKAGRFAAEAIASDTPEDYARLWKKRFGMRFAFIKRIWKAVSVSERLIEKFVEMHKASEIQEASMRLWLDKRSPKSDFLAYAKALSRVFLRK